MSEPLTHTEYVEMLRGREFTPERLAATVQKLYDQERSMSDLTSDDGNLRTSSSERPARHG